MSFGYIYNPVGNILDILDQVNPTNTRTHTYDALQRLKTGGTASNAESYSYDLVGNRTTSFLSSSHNHDDLNRLTEDEQFTYTYDNNGNLKTKTNKAIPMEVTTYHWDAQDQLIQIDRPDSTTVTYKYDGLGRRIEKNIAGTITRYVYDGEDILLEYDGTHTFLARYSHGDQVDQPLILQKAGVGFFYYHSNHQGSITHLTDNSGNIANSYVYDSYGRRSQVIESVIQPYSYTGREFDVESGLYFSRARYFDANTGRFLSEDPIRFRAGDQNFYRYVFNNPVNFFDPFGLEVGDWWDVPANLQRSSEIAQELLQTHQGHNDLDDAMRHAEWMQRTAEETNEFTAELAGYGHELDNLINDNAPLDEILMDLNNNAEGRAAARENREINPNNLRTNPDSNSPCYPYCDDQMDSEGSGSNCP